MKQALPVNEVLGQIQELLRLGMAEQAEEICRALVQQVPQLGIGWFLLGRMTLQRGMIAEAEAALRNAIALEGEQAIYFADLSVALYFLDRPAEAEAAARRAIALEPSAALSWLSLGNALQRQGRLDETVQAYQQCVARDASLAAAWNNLGSVEQRLGRLISATAAYERSLALVADQPDTVRSYASALTQLGRPADAEAILRRLLTSDSEAAATWSRLGSALALLGRREEAVAAYRRALALEPGDYEAELGLAFALALLWQLGEAGEIARRIIRENPRSDQAWMLLGQVLQFLARGDEALLAYERSRSLAPHSMMGSVVLLASQYVERVSPEELLTAHRQWDADYGKRFLPASRPTVKSAAAWPLRLGFLSGDFGLHPIGFLTASLLEHLDRGQCSVVCYSDRLQGDELTERVRAAADEWRMSGGVFDDDLVEQIRRDKIDILFDLAGHSANRLLVFARKPAPLQITWLGYVGTTGMAAMDCLLADRFHVRPGEESWYAEEVLRLPNGYACYTPPANAPSVNTLPALERGYFTFGCFNNPRKYSPEMIEAWADILRQAPAARLLLKYGGLDMRDMQQELLDRFAAHGVDTGRIQFAGWSPHGELLAAYGQVDLALDTQPYSGGLTTCEALWMGVPVITYPGRTFAGRHSTSYLTTAGCEQFVAQDRAGYVALAAGWASRHSELAAIRAQLREQVRQSPVCDAPRFAADLLSLLRATCEARASARSGPPSWTGSGRA